MYKRERERNREYYQVVVFFFHECLDLNMKEEICRGEIVFAGGKKSLREKDYLFCYTN